MLSFRYRFHGHGSLRYLYKNGDAVRTRLVTFKFIKHPKRRTPRVAVVISKKVLKSAVGRNRVRRRLYEIIRAELPQLDGPYDMVFLVFSSEVMTMPHDELVSMIRQLITSADIYKK